MQTLEGKTGEGNEGRVGMGVGKIYEMGRDVRELREVEGCEKNEGIELGNLYIVPAMKATKNAT